MKNEREKKNIATKWPTSKTSKNSKRMLFYFNESDVVPNEQLNIVNLNKQFTFTYVSGIRLEHRTNVSVYWSTYEKCAVIELYDKFFYMKKIGLNTPIQTMLSSLGIIVCGICHFSVETSNIIENDPLHTLMTAMVNDVPKNYKLKIYHFVSRPLDFVIQREIVNEPGAIMNEPGAK